MKHIKQNILFVLFVLALLGATAIAISGSVSDAQKMKAIETEQAKKQVAELERYQESLKQQAHEYTLIYLRFEYYFTCQGKTEVVDYEEFTKTTAENESVHTYNLKDGQGKIFYMLQTIWTTDTAGNITVSDAICLPQ